MEEVLEAQQLRIDELERSIEEGRAALEADLGAQRAALRSASARRDAQAAEAGRAAELQAQGALSAQEAQRAALAGAVAEADLERARAQLRATSARGEAELGRLIADLEVQRGALRRLEAEAGGVEASVDRSARQLDRHAISAPVDGELADLAPLGPGDVVEVGQVLGHVVPDGEIEVAARYAPGPALGRLEVGQRARLRLEGFPWTEHGSLEATVAQVSSELREGQIEVRLRLDHPPEGLPLQHGLPGTVEVAVEGASPARLALRAAGLMGGPRRD
jgi:membrane fusion protein, adhesin transport system